MIRVAPHFAPAFNLHPMTTLKTWINLAHNRRALAALDQPALTEAAAGEATEKPKVARVLWDAPDHWSK